MNFQKTILLSGHRGYKDLEIENSWSAFNRAIDEHVDYVEFDVRYTKDKVIVVFHDLMLNRLLHINKRMNQVTLQELKQYKYDNGQDVLTLEEFFSLCAKKIKFILELKSRNLEKDVLALVEKFKIHDDIIIQSFNGRMIKKCHAIDPRLTYGLCIGPAIGKIAYSWQVKPYPVSHLNVDGPLVDDAFMHTCVAHGKNIILGAKKTWEYLDKIDTWNIQIINADNPAKIKQLLTTKKAT
nr:glycerophosphodiester phosphodiesterase [Candidatus Sigynarchaeota archaeon]